MTIEDFGNFDLLKPAGRPERAEPLLDPVAELLGNIVTGKSVSPGGIKGVIEASGLREDAKEAVHATIEQLVADGQNFGLLEPLED